MGIFDQGSGSPVDFQIEQAKIDRQREIAKALIQQGMGSPQGQMVSGHYVAPGLGGILENLGQAYFGQRKMTAADEAGTRLGQQYNEGLRGALDQYLQTKQGTPGSVQDIPADVGMENDLPSTQSIVAPVAGNARKAAIDALASQYKPLQEVGKQDLTVLTKTDPFAQLLATMQGQGSGTAGGGVVPTAGGGGGLLPGQSPDSPWTKVAPNLTNQEAMTLYASDPTGQSVAKANAERGNPIAGRENGVYRLNPTTGKMEQQVDLAGQVGTVTAAKKNAENQGDFMEVTLPDGSKQTVTRAQMATLTGQGPVQVPGQGQPQTGMFQGQDLLNQLPQAVRKGILDNSRATGTSEFNLNWQDPETGRVIRGHVNLASGPVNGAGGGVGNPGGGTIQPAGNNGAAGGGVGFKSGITPANEMEQKGRGEALAKVAATIDEGANTAMTLKARIAAIRAETQDMKTGAAEPLKQFIGSWAIGLGADPEVVHQKFANVSGQEALNKEALQMSFDIVRQLGSREAMGVIQMAVKANPNLALQPDAMKKILNMMEGVSDFALAKQQAASNWEASHGSLKGFEANWNATQPITKYVDVAGLRAPAPMGSIQPNKPITPGAAPTNDGWSIKRVR